MNFKEQYLTKNTNIYFISEIGINHNGIFDLAIQMIEKSKEAGASAVKFQKRDAECLLLSGTKLETPTGYLSKDAEDLPIELIDSQNGSIGIGLIALRGAEAVKSAKPKEDILKIIHQAVENTTIYKTLLLKSTDLDLI